MDIFLGDFSETVRSWFDKDSGFWKVILAVVILIVGYFAAKVIAKVLEKLLAKFAISEKFAALVGGDAAGAAKGFGIFVFWILMLFVLLIGMDIAGLGDALNPLREMLQDILGAIPNILKAGVLLAISILLATIVRKLLGNVLRAARLDQRLGADSGTTPITTAICTAIFYFIILVILPGVLEALQLSAVAGPVKEMVEKILEYIPNLLVAVIIFAIGYLVAKIAREIVTNTLKAVGFNRLPSKLGFPNLDEDGSASPSSVVGMVVMAVVLLIFFTQAVDALQLEVLTGLSDGLIVGFLNILGGVIVLGIGVYLGNLVHKAVVLRNAILAGIAKWSIYFFAGAMGLSRAGIAPEISSTTSLLLVGALAVALGIGGAIAIGLGGKESVARYLEKRLK